MSGSLWHHAARVFGVFVGANLGIALGYAAGEGEPLVLRVCAYGFFVPLMAMGGFAIAYAMLVGE